MKSLARSYIWWPGMDGDIELRVKECYLCQQTRNNTPPSPLLPWEFPQRAWERVHVDFAGPYEGKMFFILVRTHFQMARSEANVHCYFYHYHRLPPLYFLHTWLTRSVRVGQWCTINQRRVQGFHGLEWNSPLTLSTIPPSNQWVGRTSRLIIQTQHGEERQRFHCDQGRTIPFQILPNAPLNDRSTTSRAPARTNSSLTPRHYQT